MKIASCVEHKTGYILCVETGRQHVPRLNNVATNIIAHVIHTITSRKTIFCDNVQCDKKCDLLVQCDMKLSTKNNFSTNEC